MIASKTLMLVCMVPISTDVREFRMLDHDIEEKQIFDCIYKGTHPFYVSIYLSLG